MIKLCTIIIIYSIGGEASMDVMSAGDTLEDDCITVSHDTGDILDEIEVKGQVYMVWGDGKTM